VAEHRDQHASEPLQVLFKSKSRTKTSHIAIKTKTPK